MTGTVTLSTLIIRVLCLPSVEQQKNSGYDLAAGLCAGLALSVQLANATVLLLLVIMYLVAHWRTIVGERRFPVSIPTGLLPLVVAITFVAICPQLWGNLAGGMAGLLGQLGVAANPARQPEVEYAHPNWLKRPSSVPNDTQYASRQWNMALLDMPRAWDINPGGAGVTVAVIDTGLTSVNATYPFKTWDGTAIVTAQMPVGISPDMDPARIAAGGRDFVFWTGPVIDFDGHGTHVSGTATQTTNNNLGYAGIAYNAMIMPLKVCLSFWDIQILQAEFGVTGFPSLNGGGCRRRPSWRPFATQPTTAPR